MHLPETTSSTSGADPDRLRDTKTAHRNTSTYQRRRRRARAGTSGWLILLAIVGALGLALAAVSPGVLADHVDPTTVPASKRVKSCTHFEPDGEEWKELRVDPGQNGEFSNEDITITITNYTGKVFDWEANRTLDAVYVRGGANDASNLYEYDPPETSDTNLTTPGDFNEIQYISFCYQTGDVPIQEVPTIEVLKTPDGQEVEAEQQFDWNIEIINSGTVDADNVTLDDTIPQGLLVFSAVPSQGSCTVVGQQVTCDLGTITAGSSANVAITVLATGEECGRIDNTATVTAEGTQDDTTTESDDGHVFVVCADAQVNKTARQASVALGEDVVFDVTVEANGPNASENVTLSDQLPEISGGWTLSGANASDCSLSASDEVTCDFGTLEPGDTRAITLTGATGESSDCGTIQNTATIDSDLDLDDTNDSDTATTDVECPDVSVNKTAADDTISAGDDASFTITVEAVGNASAPNTTLNDTLPGTGWSLSGADAGDCQLADGQNLTCDFGTLAGGDTRSVTVSRATTSEDCGTLTNTAQVAADGDTNAANDQDSASIAVACGDVSVDKTAVDATVTAGDDVSFDVVVTSEGPGPAENATLSDPLPGSGWSLSGADAADCSISASDELTCDFGTLAEGETRSITVSRATTSEDCVTVTNTAAVTADGDTNTANDEDTATATVLCPDLELDKTPDGATQELGDVFNFTIAVTNTGDGAARDVEVTDTVPDGLDVLRVLPQADCSFVDQDVTCTFDEIASGDTVEIQVTVQAMVDSCGFNTNTAEVTASNEPADALDDNADDATVTVECPEDRANFAHRPRTRPEDSRESYLGGTGLFVNELDSPHTNVSVRLYGSAGLHAPATYDEASDAFDRTVVPSDSATFNPALIQHLDPGEGTITGCEGDADLKKHLRTWYEPAHAYDGSRVDAGDYQATRGDVVQVESTYRLIDSSSLTPTRACENSQFPFPTQGVHLEAEDGHEQPGLDTMTSVTVGEISGAGTAGTVELEDQRTLDVGDSVQFLDHRVTLTGLVTDLEGQTNAQIDVEYLGNTFADAKQTVDLRERQYFTRANIAHEDALHDAGSDTRTFYAELVNVDEDDETATLLVGKELAQGDTLYVDGVRYDVPAVTVVDGQLDAITLRTPIPKSDPEGSWTSVTDETREERVDGQFQVQDNSEVTTQWLVEVDVDDPIPVDPPFNRETYRMVDDTDVQLWEQGEANEETNFPYGEPEQGLPDGDGSPMFPEGERYVTMEDPPQDWIDHFDAQPTGFNDTGTNHADSLSDRFATADGINHDAWAPSELTGPHEFDVDQVNFTWVREAIEDRHSKNVLEIRQGDEFVAESDPTLPDRYTEFQLPDRPNPVSRLEADLAFDDPCSRMDVVPGGIEGAECEQTYQLLGGDYLVTTSFRLQDQVTRHAFALDSDDNTEETLPGNEHSLDDVDLYFNERNLTAIFDGDRPDVANVTARLYGEAGQTNQAPDLYTQTTDPFDATVIPKDSATFNPAIVRHTDPGSGSITACGEDAHLKKHLRLWYEPEHAYDGPRIEAATATTADIIQLESTYQLIDASSYRPVDACADTSSFLFPTEGAHLEAGDGHEQPGLDTLQTVQVGGVSAGSGTDGTVELERRVTLDGPGDSVQMFDHRVELLGLVQSVSNGDETRAQLDIGYLGNYQGASPQTQTHEVRDRIYLTRSNDAVSAPAHDAGSSTATWYVELASFDEDDETATVIVGKEIQAGDTFYADGVRYDVPSVATDDGRLAHLTLRTPIPKSDPGGTWTRVTDETREQLINGQWQVEDSSEVTTQFLVQVDNKDPIPVDPPFNQETYNMVDDTDVQLWQPTANEESFPFGPTEESLPEGTGTPMFPAGPRYLTMQSPSQEWADFFEIEPTGFLDAGDSYADEMPQRIAEADGINHDAWTSQGTQQPPAIAEENATFYWLKEWYEGRYSSNLLEIPNNETFRGEQVQTLPDRYTEFVLPDRPNPVSATDGPLAYGNDPACTRTDVVDARDCDRTVPLLGGDYAILTSLVEGDGPAQPEPATLGPVQQDADTHPYDTDGDCVMSDSELLALVADWGDGQVSDDVLLDGVAAWGIAPDAYC